MPKSTPKATIAAVPGRLQPGREPAPLSARAQVRAERRLHTAMLVPIEQIVPDPEQPRTNLDDAEQRAALEELAASIREYGVQQPLLVREFGLLDDHRTQFMIVAGERRYLAAQMAGKDELPIVLFSGDPKDIKVIQLLENTQRENLSALDEARRYWVIMQSEHLSGRQLTARVKKSHSYVVQRLSLLKHPEVQDALRAGAVSATVGQEIAQIKDEEARQELLARAGRERLRVKDVKEVQQGLRRPSRGSGEGETAGVTEVDGTQPGVAESPSARDGAGAARAHDGRDEPGRPSATATRTVRDDRTPAEGVDLVSASHLVDLATLNTVRLTSRGRGTAPWDVVWAALEADRAALWAKRPHADGDGDG